MDCRKCFDPAKQSYDESSSKKRCLLAKLHVACRADTMVSERSMVEANEKHTCRYTERFVCLPCANCIEPMCFHVQVRKCIKLMRWPNRVPIVYVVQYIIFSVIIMDLGGVEFAILQLSSKYQTLENFTYTLILLKKWQKRKRYFTTSAFGFFEHFVCTTRFEKHSRHTE